MDLPKKIENILIVVEETKSSKSKHKLSIRKINRKQETVSKQQRSLSDRTLALKSKVDLFENWFLLLKQLI